jgi:hypothetical protein
VGTRKFPNLQSPINSLKLNPFVSFVVSSV